ncbi:MAG: hypothetical protein IJL47_06715 [Lachnospiraceae bacterium]|nr:hypothetical protein [Lachnospiraceae bacterium]
MNYAFDASITAAKGKLSKEDKNEIRSYLSEVRVEAPDPDKAVRLLIKQLQGRLKGEVTEGEAVFGLPDYGACTVKVKAHEED